ncbi:hypothetical protein [Vreelandella populi]|uniref:hypothetical protein n=1 Tax=Vreelandella populi TaxID=2498858 RepID=UPI001C8D841F|nr:hypothetical protein [Halomonas populi]
MKEASSTHYGSTAYRADAIPSLPVLSKKRDRIGEELLPFGDYAGIDPYQQICEDAESVQHQDRQDKAFYETDDWWWDHQRIRFLKSQLRLSALLMAFPFIYLCVLVGVPFFVASGVSDLMHDSSPALATLVFTIVFGGGFIAAVVMVAYTTQPVFN